MAKIVKMTPEQMQQLIESVRAATAVSVYAKLETNYKSKFTTCHNRFGGESILPEELEEFIDSTVAYKELEGISDEDAIKGLPLLFYGFAATWWQGIRKEAKTWNDAVRLLREHFSPAKTAAQIYKEIFEKKQDEKTVIGNFVSQKRALLAQLPEGRHDEETEIDLIYELLNIKYQKYIARTDIKTFRELLEQGRIIERNMVEDEKPITEDSIENRLECKTDGDDD